MGKVIRTKLIQLPPNDGSAGVPSKQPISFNHSFRYRNLDPPAGPNQILLDKYALVNLLNYIHFRNEKISLVFESPDLSRDHVLQAIPEPCQGDLLNCRLPEGWITEFDLSRCHFHKLIVEDGTSIILVPSIVIRSESNSITLQLPEYSQVLQRRKARRYATQGISVEIIQYDFAASGILRDFCSDAFRIEVKPRPVKRPFHFDPEAPVFAILHRENQVFFTGVCRCVRREDTTECVELVLISEEDRISRFKRSRIRNPRIRLEMAPRISFDHPFFGKRIQLDVADISTAGFSVAESSEESVLMPGLIIPDLTINYAGTVKLRCSAQVVYRSEEDGGLVRSGVSILDMSLKDYSRLAYILTNSLDPHLHVSGDVDLESLWEFFFSSGFIYPKKYSVLHSEKEGCKETCKRLYQQDHEIARHFTYEKNGHIFGHISMVRAYDQTWVIHHHASQTVDRKRNGFGVLKALMLFLNDMRRFPSARMKYAMCFYRPENRFPAAVFGDFAAAIGNRRICSVDRFSYHAYPMASLGAHMPSEWHIEECEDGALSRIIDWYKDRSNGLMFDAMGLCQAPQARESIERFYDRLGLIRRTKVFSLKNRDKLMAGFIVNEADPGLNLSQLLSSITLLVIDENGFPWPLLSGFLASLMGEDHTYGIPVLIYPSDSAKGKIPSFGKYYEMWILDARHGEEYLDFIEKKFKLGFSKNILIPGIT